MADFLPEPKEKVTPVSLALDDENRAWLDEVAVSTGRSRSEVAREIFRNVRLVSANPGRRMSDRKKAG